VPVRCRSQWRLLVRVPGWWHRSYRISRQSAGTNRPKRRSRVSFAGDAGLFLSGVRGGCRLLWPSREPSITITPRSLIHGGYNNRCLISGGPDRNSLMGLANANLVPHIHLMSLDNSQCPSKPRFHRSRQSFCRVSGRTRHRQGRGRPPSDRSRCSLRGHRVEAARVTVPFGSG
jgi:hypothetical protein